MIFFHSSAEKILRNGACGLLQIIYLCKTRKQIYERYNQDNIQSGSVSLVV